MDNVGGGVNDWLLSGLGVENVRPLVSHLTVEGVLTHSVILFFIVIVTQVILSASCRSRIRTLWRILFRASYDI